MGILEILCGGGLFAAAQLLVVERWGDDDGRLPPAVVLLLQPLVEDGDEEREKAVSLPSRLMPLLWSSRCVVNAAGPPRRKCSRWLSHDSRLRGKAVLSCPRACCACGRSRILAGAC